ncbi:MAG: hypothetical protein ACT4OO_11170, partial [Nitrospiraceae bacterium]
MRDHLVLEGIPRRISVGIMLTVIGCAPIQETSSTPRTAIEQLLLGQAIERALEDLSVPIPDEQSLALEVTGLQTDRTHLRMNEDKRGILDNPSWDLDFVRDVVAARLGEMGYRIHKQEQGAPYLVRVMVQA